MVDIATALHRLVAALDLRLPVHNSPAERLAGLLEETGELTEALTAPQGTVERSTAVAKELQDVLRVVVGIAHHYGLRAAVPNTIPMSVHEPFTLLVQLVGAAGAVATAVHHLVGTGVKRANTANPICRTSTSPLARVIDAVLRNATHHGHLDALHASLQESYRAYQRDNYLPTNGNSR